MPEPSTAVRPMARMIAGNASNTSNTRWMSTSVARIVVASTPASVPSTAPTGTATNTTSTSTRMP